MLEKIELEQGQLIVQPMFLLRLRLKILELKIYRLETKHFQTNKFSFLIFYNVPLLKYYQNIFKYKLFIRFSHLSMHKLFVYVICKWLLLDFKLFSNAFGVQI